MTKLDAIHREEDARRRRGDPLADGEIRRIPMTMMDAMPKDHNSLAMVAADMSPAERDALVLAINDGHPLSKAVEMARAAKRVEQFDARWHRPGFHSASLAANDVAVKEKRLADERERLSNAWKNPPPVLDKQTTLREKPIKPAASFDGPVPDRSALDAAYQRHSERLEAAWKHP